MDYTQSFYIKDSYVGSNTVSIPRHHQIPNGEVWVCPTCSEVWAKVHRVFDFTGEIQRYSILSRECKDCGNKKYMKLEYPAGSIRKPYSDGAYSSSELEDWPDEIVVREFWLHIEAFDRYFKEI